jgi:hypothetical protein
MTYADDSIDDFLSAVASESVTPAGGTTAAVVGATGAALCEMVCLHSSDVADADADAVATLLAAQPTDDAGATPEAKRATGVPLAIAEACSAVLDHAPVVTEVGSPVAVPDAVTGAVLARAAVRAAVHRATQRRPVDHLRLRRRDGPAHRGGGTRRRARLRVGGRGRRPPLTGRPTPRSDLRPVCDGLIILTHRPDCTWIDGHS